MTHIRIYCNIFQKLYQDNVSTYVWGLHTRTFGIMSKTTMVFLLGAQKAQQNSVGTVDGKLLYELCIALHFSPIFLSDPM